MATKELIFRSAAREKILRGASALADAVRITLGPKSKSVLIQKQWGQPIVCNDGVTIAKELQLEDAAENLGAQMLRQAAEKTGELVGDVLLTWASAEHRQGEIGYVLHPEHAGRGYVTEAAREMLRLGFDGLGLHRIVGRLDARNAASARVLERLGMRREAHLRENEFVKGEWTDELVYALLAREWRAGATDA